MLIELNKAFIPYVKKGVISDYNTSLLKRKMKDKKLFLSVLKNYIDLEYSSRKSKKQHDILIINYALVELPFIGLKQTTLFKDYLKKGKKKKRS